MDDKESKSIVSTTGTPLSKKDSPGLRTERSDQREKEDTYYTPVIVKRFDFAKVHPDDILERAIRDGLEQLKRPLLSLLLSSIAAGLVLGFSAMAVAVVATFITSEDILTQRLATAVVYPLGFIICIMSGSQLFTEHTATALYPILDRRAKFVSLVRLWIVVISGNLIGTAVSAVLINAADSVVHAHQGYLEIARHLLEFGFPSLLVSSILAGWLMAQGAWLIMATPHQTSQIICIYIATFVIGIGGLHHSIVGSAEVFLAAIQNPKIGLGDVSYFLGTALLGNLIGGSTFVGILNYGHIRETQAKS